MPVAPAQAPGAATQRLPLTRCRSRPSAYGMRSPSMAQASLTTVRPAEELGTTESRWRRDRRSPCRTGAARTGASGAAGRCTASASSSARTASATWGHSIAARRTAGASSQGPAGTPTMANGGATSPMVTAGTSTRMVAPSRESGCRMRRAAGGLSLSLTAQSTWEGSSMDASMGLASTPPAAVLSLRANSEETGCMGRATTTSTTAVCTRGSGRKAACTGPAP
mmetsp:Transcript_65352/g.202269  ORF Transcript_65352/g.202269 Transcript_65352/m.202269 type:complete len:224 (+) Transcript_65352:64-735(+)